MAHRSKVVTQLGNQGSSSHSLRCVEIIKAGGLGQIQAMYHWGIGVEAREGSPEGEDPFPGLQLGPVGRTIGHAPLQGGGLHPAPWRGWFDFGNGGLADFGCHVINLPMRALNLGYPERLVVNIGADGSRPPDRAAVEFHFAARRRPCTGDTPLAGSRRPPADVIKPLTDLFGDRVPDGFLILGEKGCIHTSHWNTDGLIRLNGEPELQRVRSHAAPSPSPRAAAHYGA